MTKHRGAIRIGSIPYLAAILFILLRDIPHGTFNPLNNIVVTYVVLYNTALVVNIIRLAWTRATFTATSALYIAALIGFFMAAATNTPFGVPEVVFGVCLLYIALYSVVLAMRGVWRGNV